MKRTTKEQLTKELRLYSDQQEADQLVALAEQISTSAQALRPHKANKQGLKRLHTAVKEPVPRGHRLLRRVFIPAMALTTFAIVIVVSESAIPGHKTYAVKKLTENIVYQFARTPMQKAVSCSKIMRRRADELAKLPPHQLTDEQVSTMVASILTEAEEYQQLINGQGVDKASLVDRRQTDTAFVTARLQSIDHSQLSEESASTLRNALTRLATLNNEA